MSFIENFDRLKDTINDPYEKAVVEIACLALDEYFEDVYRFTQAQLNTFVAFTTLAIKDGMYLANIDDVAIREKYSDEVYGIIYRMFVTAFKMGRASAVGNDKE